MTLRGLNWHQWVFAALVGLGLIGCGLTVAGLVSGCAVTPKPIYGASPSLDGDSQNSGFLGWVGSEGHVTAEAHSRYVELAAIYRKDFLPELDPAAGVTALPDGTFLFSKEALGHFGQMATWRRSGFQPTAK